MLNIGKINSIAPSFAQRKSGLQKKSDEFLKDISDSIELSKERKTAISLGNGYESVQRLGDDFDDVIVTLCNNYGKLPKGYYSYFIPKTMIYTGGTTGSARRREIPSKHIIVKKKDPFDPNGKAIPPGYKLMNNSKGKTYIVPEKTDLETLDQKTKSFLSRLIK